MKNVQFKDSVAEFTITDGPAAGTYSMLWFNVERNLDGDILDLQKIVKVNGKEVNLKIRLSDTVGSEGLEQWLEDQKALQESLPCECDRCGCEFPRSQATMRRVRVGAVVAPMPYCPGCAKFLWEVEDGFGESENSVEPADLTSFHKPDFE